MAQYTVQAPDGKTITLEGPEGASHEDVIAQAQKLYQASSSSPGRGGTPQIKAAQATRAETEAARKKAERIAKFGPDPSDKYSGIAGVAGDLAAGVGAGVFQTVDGAARLAGRVVGRDPTKPVLPESLTHVPDTMAGSIGNIAENMGEFMVGAGEAKVGAKLLSRMGKQAIAGGAQAGLKSGGDPVSTAVGAGVGAGGELLSTGIGKVIAKVANAPKSKLSEEVAAELAAKARVAADEAAAVGERTAQAIADARQLRASTGTNLNRMATRTAREVGRSVDDAGSAVTASEVVGNGAASANEAKSTGAAHDAALGASSRLSEATGATQFEGLPELAEAAKAGEGRAGNLLKDIEASAGNPGRIQRASIALKNWLTGKESSRLYADVENAIAKAGIAGTDVPLEATEGVIANAIKDASTGKLPANERLVSLLKKIQDNIGAGDSDELVDNSYRAIRKLDDDIGNAIRDGSKGKDALIGDAEVRYLQQIRTAVRQDMDRFVSKSGVPEVVEAAKKADTYYRQTRVPFKELDIAGSGTATDADQIFDKFIKAGKGDAAQRFYNALDEKGRASVRAQMVQDALNHATDPVRGVLDPEAYFNAHGKLEDAYGVFFKGADKFQMDGVKNLMKEAALAKDAVKGSGPSPAALEEFAAAQARKKAITDGSKANAVAGNDQLAAELRAEVSRLKAEARAAMDSANTSAQRAAAAKAFADAEAKARNIQNKTIIGVLATDIGASMIHGNPIITGTIGAAAAIKAAMNTQQGRRLMMAASTLKPGSAPMAELLQKVVEEGRKVATGAAIAGVTSKP